MEKARKKAVALLLAAAVAAGGIGIAAAVRSPKVALAGRETKTLLTEGFDSGSLTLDPYLWRKNPATDENTAVVAEGDAFTGLNIIGLRGKTTSAVVSADGVKAGSGARVELDVHDMRHNHGMWTCFNFGTQIPAGDLMEYNYLTQGVGKHAMLVYDVPADGRPAQWRFRYYYKVKSLPAVDGEGEEVSHVFEAAAGFNDYQLGAEVKDDEGNVLLGNAPAVDGKTDGMLSDVTLTCEMDKDGYLELSARKIGTPYEDRKVLVHTTVGIGTTFAGRTGINWQPSNVDTDGYISDVRVGEIENIAGNEHRISTLKDTETGETSFREFFVSYDASVTGFFCGTRGNLAFTKGSASDAAVFMNGVEVEASDLIQTDNLIFESTIRIGEIAGDALFGLGIGAKSYLSAFRVQSGTTFVYFRPDGGSYKVGAKSYGEEGAVTQALNETALPGGVDPAEMRVRIVVHENKGGSDATPTAELTIDGSEVGSFSVPGYAGRVFFGTSGNTDEANYAEAFVDDISVTNRMYARPSNKDVEANFDDDEFNLNEWTTLPLGHAEAFGGHIRQKSTGVYVEDGALHFDQVNQNAHFTTQTEYSNFEFTCDVTDVLREPVFDAYGMVKPASTMFGVMYSISNSAYLNNYSYLYVVLKYPYVTFAPVKPAGSTVPAGYIDPNGTTRVSLNNITLVSDAAVGSGVTNVSNLNIYFDLPEKYDFFDPSYAGKTIGIRVTMVDGMLGVWLKAEDDAEWFKAVEGDTGNSSTGRVALRGYGEPGVMTTSSSFTADNLSVKNLDQNPANQHDYGYKSNRDGKTTEDPWEYESAFDPANVYAGDGSNAKSGGKGCGAVHIGSGAAAFGVLALAAAMILRRKRG